MARRLKNSGAVKRRFLNFRASAETLDLSVAPVLIPEQVYKTLAEEGSYEFVERLKAPMEGDGGIYTPEFFESYLSRLAEKPIPGNKMGHLDTPVSDFYTVGGAVNRTGDNEADVYFRILVPPTDYAGNSNTGLVRDVKAKVAQFSLVTDGEQTRGADGKTYVTSSLGGERNDRVDYGAMDQDILANKGGGEPPDEKAILALVEAGAIDTESDDKNSLTANGKVCRSAALHLQFNGPDKALGARLMNAIAAKLKSQEKEKGKVTKQEIIDAAKTAIANNDLTLEELAEALKMENKLRNATDEQRAKLAAAIAEALELPPETALEDLLKAAQAAFDEAKEAGESVVDAEASGLANGKTLKNSKGEDEDNPAYLYAKNQLKGLRGARLKNAVTALKKDTVMTSLLSKNADPMTAARNGGAKDGDYAAVELEV